MALAPFFQRAAIAASQVILGFDEAAFVAAMDTVPVGLAVGRDASQSTEGRAIADLAIRLLARLYPRLELTVEDEGLLAELTGIGLATNPNLEYEGGADLGIAIGDGSPYDTTVFAGSDRWVGMIGETEPMRVADSNNPFGPAIGASLAAGQLFRHRFMSDPGSIEVTYLSGWSASREVDQGPDVSELTLGPVTLVGLGAIGNAASWCLTRLPRLTDLDLVDSERLELGNVQRYVLSIPDDVGELKVDIIARLFRDGSVVKTYPVSWEEYVASKDFRVQSVLVAVDSASTRRSVQAGLPQMIINSWTQPGDLGISEHGRFGDTGACLACIYLPDDRALNEDEIVATALGIPERTAEVRQLLDSGQGLEPETAAAIAAGLSVDEDLVGSFVGRPVRDLYVEGVCGGAVLPLGTTGTPAQNVHVPLAHQSCLAGVLLGAAWTRQWGRGGVPPESTRATRIDVLAPLGEELSQILAADQTQRCICRDSDYISAYEAKWA